MTARTPLEERLRMAERERDAFARQLVATADQRDALAREVGRLRLELARQREIVDSSDNQDMKDQP